MLLRRGVPMEQKPFQLGVRIEQPQAPIDRVRYGASAGHPALGAAEYTRLGAGRHARSLHVLHVRGRLRDAQRERSRLLLHQRHEREPARFAVCQQRAGRHDRARRDRRHPSACGRPLPAAGRAARLPGGGPIVRSTAAMGPRLSGRAEEPRQDPDQLSPWRAGDRPGPLPARARRWKPS